MADSELDRMIEFALESLLSGEDGRRRAMVRRLVLRWPSAPALQVVFAITSAGAQIEEAIGGTVQDEGEAALAYRLAALLAADVFAVERQRCPPVAARDLLAHWRDMDPYFLQL